MGGGQPQLSLPKVGYPLDIPATTLAHQEADQGAEQEHILPRLSPADGGDRCLAGRLTVAAGVPGETPCSVSPDPRLHCSILPWLMAAPEL